jgi:pimeloyl-ACP methyl ester carboxylesterase
MLILMKSITFVLVHGAWHGGWCWKQLMPLLRAAGHQVYAPTLTGLGERSHLLTPEIDMVTHIKDVNAVLEYEDLHDVVLVGHSYGGMVIAGVEQLSHRRLAELVYLDAFLPENGKALRDYAPVPPTRDDGWRIPPPGTATEFGITDKADAAWTSSRLGDQPVKTFTQPIQLSNDHSKSFVHVFIQCTDAPFIAEAGQRAKRQAFQYRKLLRAGHDAMISEPSALAKLLLELPPENSTGLGRVNYSR